MVSRNKEVHYIMINGLIPQKDITVVNICTPNIRASKDIKQILTGRSVGLKIVQLMCKTVFQILGRLNIELQCDPPIPCLRHEDGWPLFPLNIKNDRMFSLELHIFWKQKLRL